LEEDLLEMEFKRKEAEKSLGFSKGRKSRRGRSNEGEPSLRELR